MLDVVIFDNKKLSDMFADVYKNTETKRAQINQYVTALVKFISTPEDAAVLGPVIKDFLEVNVRNDEHIVRLVQIAQRLVSINKVESSDVLSDEEKQQLLDNIKEDFNTVLTNQEKIQDEIDDLTFGR